MQCGVPGEGGDVTVVGRQWDDGANYDDAGKCTGDHEETGDCDRQAEEHEITTQQTMTSNNRTNVSAAGSYEGPVCDVAYI